MLRCWDELLHLREKREGAELPPPVVETGSALRDGAREEEIVALERRLGVALPPSYRAFLRLSNGAYAQPGWGFPGLPLRISDPAEQHSFGLHDAARVGWFRDREPGYCDTWGYLPVIGLEGPTHPLFERRVPECEYLDHEGQRREVNEKQGHVRYALQISGDVDGYTILLNPLVLDSDGEWEAWDFGHKNVGAIRYRSFGDLLGADIEQLEEELARPRWQEQMPPPADIGATTVSELGPLLLDSSADTAARQIAAARLGASDDPSAVAALVAAADDPEPRVQAAVFAQLAARPEAETRGVVVARLTAPDVDDHVIGSVPRDGRDVLWEAWKATHDHRLLLRLVHCVDWRAAAAIESAMLDPSTPRDVRYSLTSGYWWQRDGAVLAAAAELPDAPLVYLGQGLARIGARDEAARVLARALDTDWVDSAAEALGALGTPAALAVLLDAFDRQPTSALALALGAYDDPRASEALLSAAGRVDVRLALVDALEKMRGDHAADALAVLASRGELLAVRALARRRDERALEPLLAALASDDPDVAFEGADGLRDLRSHAAAPALLAAVESAGDDDVVACAAHALVSMQALETASALELLSKSPTTCLRRLAELWR